MKTCKLQGGLGNQMFQYAVVRATEADRNRKVLLDTYFLRENKGSTDTFTARELELDIFQNLNADYLTNSWRKILLSKGVFYRLIRTILRVSPLVVKQIENEFINIPQRKNLYLDGYFQSEKYFSHIREELLNQFKFPSLDGRNTELAKKMTIENSVSIHVRHGDFLKLKTVSDYHGVLPLSYYKDALERLGTEKDLTFYIFSDDSDFIRSEFGFLSNRHIIDWNTGRDSWKDMALMSTCKHHIIANSSFSWWGAWLSSGNGYTIAPSKWFGDKANYNISDFISDRWQTINI